MNSEKVNHTLAVSLFSPMGLKNYLNLGKHIEIDIFSDEYMARINAIQLQNTKIKILQRLLSQAIEEYKKVNKIKGIEFSERLRQVVDEYNNRRRDEAYANEVLDEVAEQLAKLLSELKAEKNSFADMGIDFEEGKCKMPHNQHDINLTFLQQKGFKTSTIEGLNKALHWLKTTDADCLMHGEGIGDPFDIMVGEMRRPMLIANVEVAITILEKK